LETCVNKNYSVPDEIAYTRSRNKSNDSFGVAYSGFFLGRAPCSSAEGIYPAEQFFTEAPAETKAGNNPLWRLFCVCSHEVYGSKDTLLPQLLHWAKSANSEPLSTVMVLSIYVNGRRPPSFGIHTVAMTASLAFPEISKAM
jgi:hypothetical protein